MFSERILPLMATETYTHFTEWSAVKNLFIQVIGQGEMDAHFSLEDNKRLASAFRSRWQTRQSWNGGMSGQDVIETLRRGYKIPGYAIEDADISPLRKRRKMEFNDQEGEYQHDLFISGFDSPYLTFQQRDKIPSVDIECDCSFTHFVPGSVITEYARWVIKMLMNLDSSGIDTAVTITGTIAAPFEPTDKSKQMVHWIRVKRINEVCDPHEWSAIFCPGGYRMITLLELIKASDAVGKSCNLLLGYPRGKGWRVEFDREYGKIRMCSDSHSELPFPRAKMTAEFLSAIEEAKRCQ